MHVPVAKCQDFNLTLTLEGFEKLCAHMNPRREAGCTVLGSLFGKAPWRLGTVRECNTTSELGMHFESMIVIYLYIYYIHTYTHIYVYIYIHSDGYPKFL